MTNCLLITLISFTRIALYIIPPIIQIVWLISLDTKTLPIALMIFALLIAALSIPSGFLLIYRARGEDYLFYYKLHDYRGLYESFSLSTYLIAPAIINIVLQISISNSAFQAWINYNWTFIIIFCLSMLIGYIVTKPNFKLLMKTVAEVVAKICHLILLIVLPIIQVVFSSNHKEGSATILTTIWIYSLGQCALAIYGGARLLYTVETKSRYDGKIWCNPWTTFANLNSGSYILYMMIPWFGINLIVSWVNYSYLSIWGKLVIYTPILTYILGLPIGYSISYWELVNTTIESDENTRLVVKVDEIDNTNGSGININNDVEVPLE